MSQFKEKLLHVCILGSPTFLIEGEDTETEPMPFPSPNQWRRGLVSFEGGGKVRVKFSPQQEQMISIIKTGSASQFTHIINNKFKIYSVMHMEFSIPVKQPFFQIASNLADTGILKLISVHTTHFTYCIYFLNVEKWKHAEPPMNSVWLYKIWTTAYMDKRIHHRKCCMRIPMFKINFLRDGLFLLHIIITNVKKETNHIHFSSCLKD